MILEYSQAEPFIIFDETHSMAIQWDSTSGEGKNEIMTDKATNVIVYSN
jgi:hypothetical protein